MTTDLRTLVLMRHATAEPTGATDVARALTPRGEQEATDAGLWLASQGFAPDHALVSGATRTRQSWAAAAGAAGWSVPVEPDDGLYAAGPDATLDLVRAVPAQARALLVLGHNPTVAYLAQLLSDGAGDPDLVRQMALGFPPATAVLMTVDTTWADLDVAGARVVGFRGGRR